MPHPRPGARNTRPFLIVVSRLWAGAQASFQPGKTPPVYFTPLDDGTTLLLQTDLQADAGFESALNQLEQRLNTALTPKLTPADKQLTINSMAMLGTVDVPDAMWAQNVYGLAFSTGRRYQLKLNGGDLRDAIQRVADADLQHLAASVLSPEKRDTVIVGGVSLLDSAESDARLSVDSTGVSAEEVMNAFVEAHKNLDLETMLSIFVRHRPRSGKKYLGRV